MKREVGLEAVQRDDRAVVTVGTFDGVHLAHRAILEYVMERARTQQGRSTVVTFDPHPRSVLQGKEVPLLTTVRERGDVLEAMGLERLVVVTFTQDFARLRPEEYVEEVLVSRVGVQEMVVGYDHHFGRGGEGDTDLLKQLGGRYGFEVDIIPPQVVDEETVSSSQIRRLLIEDGDVDAAGKRLGRPYQLEGTIVRGDGRGKQIGFPTANLVPVDARKVVPRVGVYAVQVERPSAGEQYRGMMNIGVRPTFEGTHKQLEVHLFDFDDELYGETLRVAFVERIRDEQKFDGVDELVAQLRRDRERSEEILAAAL